MSALHDCTATRLADLIRGGEVSSREVVAAHLARIAAVNGPVNAVTVVLSDEAMAAAERADRVRRVGGPMPPLLGVPFTVKESIDCVGTPTTFGLRARSTALPHLDAPVVARLKAAGAVLLGRTNLSEMAMRLCSDSPLRGRTRNPRDLRVTAGGSSGGDAVAVATGMSPLSIGADLGGSLRVPAHCCGVAALKPTTGRIPHASSLPPEDLGMAGQLMFAPGPMARSIADLRLCLSVAAGRDLRDPRSVDAPLAGPAIAERRAALVTEVPGADVPPDSLAALGRAGALLADAGWEVDEVTPPEVERLGEIWHKLVATDLSATLPLAEPVLSPPLFGYLRRLCEAARVDEVSNNRLHEERSRLARAWSGFFSEYPVAIAPNLIGPPWPHDADLDPETGLARMARATRMILPASVLGSPAVALPVALEGSAPASIQVLADLWREDLCLEVAEILERAFGTIPPIDPAAAPAR